MSIKNRAVKILEGRYPLAASLLDHCELVAKIGGSDDHLTVTLQAPSEYFSEQLQCKAMWPRVHQAIMEVVGREFTLNFETETKKPKDNDRQLKSLKLLYWEMIKKTDEFILMSFREKDEVGVKFFNKQKSILLEIEKRVEKGEEIWLSDFLEQASGDEQAS